MSKINQLNLTKVFASNKICNLWFRPSHKTSYCGHFRFQYKQIGNTGLDVFDLFHDVAHAVDFILMGKINRLSQVDFGFTASQYSTDAVIALKCMELECRTTAIQFILMKHFKQVSSLDYFLKVEKHKLFGLENSIYAFADVTAINDLISDENQKDIDWSEVDRLRNKRDSLLLRNITKLVRYNLKVLSSNSVLAGLNRLNYLAKYEKVAN